MRPQRLPIIADDGDLLALAKPVEVLVLSDNWYPRIPVLVEAVRYQAENGKAEFQRLNIPHSGLQAIYGLDPDVTGVCVLTRTPERAEKLRNDLGSGLCRFRFHILADQAPDQDELSCDLPLARHFTQARMVVSSRTGKKAQTTFRRIDRVGRYTLWEAETDFPRRHQIALHAFECGIHIVGDETYAGGSPLYLSQLKRTYRTRKRDEEETPIHPAVAIHLVEWSHQDGLRITCEPVKSFVALLKQVKRYAPRY